MYQPPDIHDAVKCFAPRLIADGGSLRAVLVHDEENHQPRYVIERFEGTDAMGQPIWRATDRLTGAAVAKLVAKITNAHADCEPDDSEIAAGVPEAVTLV